LTDQEVSINISKTSQKSFDENNSKHYPNILQITTKKRMREKNKKYNGLKNRKDPNSFNGKEVDGRTGEENTDLIDKLIINIVILC